MLANDLTSLRRRPFLLGLGLLFTCISGGQLLAVITPSGRRVRNLRCIRITMPRFCLHTCGITNLVRSLQLRLPLRQGTGRVLSTLVAESKLTLSIEPDWRQYFWAALLQPRESLASAWFSLGRWSTLSECIGFAQRSSGLSPDPLKRASMLQLNCGWGQELGPLGVASCAVCFQSSLHHNIIVNPLMRRFVAALVTVVKTPRMSDEPCSFGASAPSKLLPVKPRSHSANS